MSNRNETKNSADRSTNTTSNKKTPVKPLLCENFVCQQLKFSELEMDSERSKAQGIAFPNYGDNNNKLIFQTPEFTITQYGIPQLGDYYKDDKSRSFFKFPFDPSQPGCLELEKMFTEIDQYMVKNQSTILGRYSKLYKYKPIIKEPMVEEEIDDDVVEEKKPKNSKTTEKKERFKYWRAKMDLSYPDCEVLTKVYIKGEASPVTVRSATDMTKYVPWGSTVRCIVMMNKLWAEKTKKSPDVKFREYGLVFKVMQVETTPRDNGGNVREAFSQYAFCDNSTEESDDEQEKDKQEKTDEDNNEEAEGEEEAEEGEGEEEAEDVEEEPEPEPEPPKKSSSKKSTSNAKSSRSKK